MLNLVVFDSNNNVVDYTVDQIFSLLIHNPDCVFGLATGSTMEPVYKKIIDTHKERNISFSNITTFNVDEYTNISTGDPGSFHAYMANNLFSHIDIDPGRTFLPRTDIEPDLAAHEYEELLRKYGPIDLQLLGLGRNGHIGFNEPGCSLSGRTHEEFLTPSTLEANKPFFGDGSIQPRSAITMGIGTILEARKICVLATGVEKALAVKNIVEGPVTNEWPGSALQAHHDATLVVDRQAASLLA